MKLNGLKLLLLVSLLMCVSFIKENDASFIDKNFSFRTEILNQINQARTHGCNCGKIYMPPVAPVVWNEQLASAAYGHAADMFNNKYFSHESLNGDHLIDRLTKAGYNSKGFQRYAIGENIAAGQQSIEEVSKAWLKSEPHCKNLMNPAFKEVGVYVYNYYWVEDFGGRYSFDSQSVATR